MIPRETYGRREQHNTQLGGVVSEMMAWCGKGGISHPVNTQKESVPTAQRTGSGTRASQRGPAKSHGRGEMQLPSGHRFDGSQTRSTAAP
jgi:hypothetical protein